MQDAKGGILLVDKEEGETSHDVVEKVRRALRTRRVGHAGTLDPFATGLLLIMIGEATKLAPFIAAETKAYDATVRLGIETDTYDRTGKVLRTTSTVQVEDLTIQEVLKGFLGEVKQVPPPYSAIKVRGRRAYKLAREGRAVKLAPRKVRIHELVATEINLPFIRLWVHCSSGTYVRSLASDIGKRLGCGAHLAELRRVSIGPFRVEKAMASKDLQEKRDVEIRERIISLVDALPHVPSVEMDKEMAKRVRNGYCPRQDELDLAEYVSGHGQPFYKLVHKGELVAIAGLGDTGEGSYSKALRLERVFR
ncbi:MAG: tRNA pseudouridine(55) synthase TruB [Deltaproteobacteria bacterium]|nr:MAG: tRNA pseudouridine(55) synthase TruB [Deltaproteobacteria bacterium]